MGSGYNLVRSHSQLLHNNLSQSCPYLLGVNCRYLIALLKRPHHEDVHITNTLHLYSL